MNVPGASASAAPSRPWVKESKKPDLVRIVQAKGADRQLFERVKTSTDIAIGQKQDKASSPPVEVSLAPQKSEMLAFRAAARLVEDRGGLLATSEVDGFRSYNLNHILDFVEKSVYALERRVAETQQAPVQEPTHSNDTQTG